MIEKIVVSLKFQKGKKEKGKREFKLNLSRMDIVNFKSLLLMKYLLIEKMVVSLEFQIGVSPAFFITRLIASEVSH